MEFQNGKIYTIRSYQTNRYYIGSTNHKTLAQRLGKHRSNYKEYLNNTRRYVSSYEILKYNDYYIELLLAYPCNNKDELHRREGELIRQYKSDVVNLCIAGRTIKEYTEDNKTHIAERHKEYAKDNKVSIAERMNRYREDNKLLITEQYKQYRLANLVNIKARNKPIICNCGAVINKYHLPAHLRKNIHTININNL